MILIALDMHGRATVVDPSPIAQGTDSESVVLLSPFPVRCPVMMGWVMPDRSPVEIPLDDTQNAPRTRYWNMTNVVLPEGYDGNVQSVWTFKPTANLTAQFGTALACFYVQKPVQSEDPLTHTTIQGYKSLTYNPVEIYVTETLNPIPDGELDPESPLLEQVLEAITYYNSYLSDIEENGISTIHDTEGEPQREVYTDSTPTEDSNNLITSGAVFNAVKNAEDYTDDAEASAKAYTDDVVQNLPVSLEQAQAIAAAEQHAKKYADNKDVTVLNSAKAYAEQKADKAEEAAKDYAESLVVHDGYGTPVYENGTLSPALNIPKIYNDISEVDNTFDKNTTFAQLVRKMASNSKLVSKCFYGEKDGIVVDTYAALFPRMMDASNDLIKIEKKTAEGKEVVSAELSHNKVAVWGGAEISSPSIAVEGSYTYRCPPTPTNNTVYKIAENGTVETLSIDSNGDGTGDPVKWIYAIRWINDFDGTDKGVLLVGEDENDVLYFCRLLNGVLQWVAPATGHTLPQTLINAVELHSVVGVYTPENTFVLLDEDGILNDYGNETFTNVVSVCGVSSWTLAPNAFNFIVSDSQDNLLLYTGNNSVENTAAISLYSSESVTLTDIKLWRFNVLSGKTNGKEKIYNTIPLYISGWVLQIIDLPANYDVDIPVGSEIVSIYALHSGGANVGGYAVAIKDQTTQEVSVLIDGKEAIAGGRISSGILPTYSLPPAAHMLFTRNADVDRLYWGVNCYFSMIPEVERYVSTTNSGWKRLANEEDINSEIGTIMGEISGIETDISGLETEISSFILANNEEATVGLNFALDDTHGTAVCIGGMVSGSVSIPAYVKNSGKWYKVIDIAHDAFKNNTNIVSVHFPHTIEHIGANAFENCTGIQAIYFKPAVGYGKAQIGTIESGAFKGCSSLAYINGFDNKIIAIGGLFIGNNAFNGCAFTSLTIIAQSVTLGASVFQDCTAMTSFSVNYLESAGANVFSGCTNLATIDITNDRTLTINDAPSGATVNYYRRVANPVRKYMHHITITISGTSTFRKARMSIITADAEAYTLLTDVYTAINSDDDIFGVDGYAEESGLVGPVVEITKGTSQQMFGIKFVRYDSDTNGLVIVQTYSASSPVAASFTDHVVEL